MNADGLELRVGNSGGPALVPGLGPFLRVAAILHVTFGSNGSTGQAQQMHTSRKHSIWYEA